MFSTKPYQNIPRFQDSHKNTHNRSNLTLIQDGSQLKDNAPLCLFYHVVWKKVSLKKGLRLKICRPIFGE